MTEPIVAVVDAQTPGNIGTIARSMKNFGFTSLYLIDPPEFDEDSDAYGYAGQAREDILPNHSVISFSELVDNYHTVGFTAKIGETEQRHIRYPFTTIHELYSSLSNIEAETALVFGREPNGLENSEISQLDQICTIPANSDYPSLNLGQAATIVLYELQGLTNSKTHVDEVDRIRANEDEIESFYDRFDDFLSELDYRDEKHAKIMRLIRRLIGRAHPTGMEIHTLHGVLRKAIQEIEGE